MEEPHIIHKIKAEWTKLSTNKSLTLTKEDTEEENTGELKFKSNKIRIIEQIVFPSKNKNNVPSEETHSYTKKDKKEDRNPDDFKSVKCQICEKTFNVNQKEEHEGNHEMFDCPEKDCIKKFKRKSSLRKHLYFHKGKFKYSCEDCDEKFIDLCKFQIHKAKHNKAERIYDCKECNKTFTSSDYLRKHQVIHKGNLIYLNNFPSLFLFSSVFVR